MVSSLSSKDTGKRRHIEKFAKGLLFVSASISIAITVLIVASVFFESTIFFSKVSIFNFLFGLQWSPQNTMNTADTQNSFGAIPVFVGTLLITVIAIAVALPLGLFSAIYLSEYACKKVRTRIKPLLEILAGIPTVVYGYFAVKTIAPFLRYVGEQMGISIASESALTAGLVMGIMIIPFILSLSDDVLHSVPVTLRDASLALGSTQSETIKKVVMPAAFPGIMSAVLLGVSRAIGETMIVVMAAGLSANLTANPLNAVTTVTVQIVTLLVGDQEFDSPKTLSAFALGLTLFIITLILNIIALRVVRKYKEQYV